MIPLVYDSPFGPDQIAALAPLICATASAGDQVAAKIVRQAASYLAHTLATVIGALKMADEALEVVLTGGLLQSESQVRELVTASLQQSAPRVRVIAPRHDAAYGAALLAQMEGDSHDTER
jgi:N-acetylglucosamine kinase-like BadF-type ATPase